VAIKKSPVHTSIFARLSIGETNAIFYGTHLTTDLDISTLSIISDRGYSNVIPLSRKVSIVFCQMSKTYDRVKESQIATLLNSPNL
jgi:hypothetical protein